jgi:hypothetical protein
MPEETTVSEDKLTLLIHKIEREARFTRVLVVICMCASVAVTAYSFNAESNYIPTLVISQYMGNLDKIYSMWKLNDQQWQRRPEAAPVAAPKTPAGQPAK